MKPNETEAANRAEATAILIRCGCRVYRPEADVAGEDLVIRTSDGELLAVQLKSRPSVDWDRYGTHKIWMLFPDSDGGIPGRSWFLIKHNDLFEWMKKHHGETESMKKGIWHCSVSHDLREFLKPFILPSNTVFRKE
jgi:hypothetical protein